MREFDLARPDGRTLHAYDTAEDGRPVVVWHHGTPNVGTPPAPLAAVSAELGLRWVSIDRPGYGGSTRRPGRTVGDVAADVAALADHLGLERFAVFGHSGGSAHALACAALLPARVSALVGVAGLAPPDADRLDWFAGMGPHGVATLRAAQRGRAAKEAYAQAGGSGGVDFTPGDWAALEGVWGWFGSVVEPALAGGPQGLVDDDLAYVTPWGADPGAVTAPTLLLHGEDDAVVPAAHARWLAARCPAAELRVGPGEGHLSVLRHAEDALRWVRERV